jgi:myo-inositol-1(or 4)-monophosphatase
LDIAFIGTNIPIKSSHPPEIVHQYMLLIEKLINATYRLRPSFDDARTLGLVAQGGLDGCILLPNIDKWVDVACGILLVEEAGGKVTDWQGNPLKDRDLSKGVLVSNGVLHEQLLTIMKEAI